ncbi:bifunctional tetrahydrofolate synthase/dihydrofolate synthase [Porticoccaceae bacterium LTM1]|nr:bifunctional tetrahydrofolate synthase/dihydrofolate synthase [Porticoccaceae bacterium LTM1]
MSNSLQGWLKLLESRHPTEIDLGLERVGDVFSRLAFVRPAPRIITVGGTNGKGSCVAFLEAMLLAAGKTVGAYTSPHLLRFNERVRINGHSASDEQFCRAFEQVEVARGDVSLSYFEFTTLAAFVVIAEAGVDVALMEVGLGGRLDAVNLLDADISIITSIDLDHQDWLGDTREAVAVEKLGIARAGKPLLVGEQQLPINFESVVNEIRAASCYLGRDFQYPSELPQPSLPLPSVACAIKAAEILNISLSVDTKARLVQETGLSGRFQRFSVNGIDLVLDVAHNPAAAAMLAQKMVANDFNGCTAVTAMMADKDIDGVLDILTPGVGKWVVCDLPGNQRAASAELLAGKLTDHGSSPLIAGSVCDALDNLLATGQEGDRVLVFGSFFTVAAALEWLQQRGITL